MARSSARILVACGMLVTVAIGVVAVSWSQTTSGTPTQTVAQGFDPAAHGFSPRSLQEPSYLYEGKPEPAWILLGSACGLSRDARDRHIMFAADVQVPVTPGTPAPNGPAPTASASSMTCAQFNQWAARMLAIGKAKAFAASAPEYQAWCSEDAVVRHSCR
ncbi:MAG: hypothetical protein M3Q30_26670 [Actinomycetota bacterium]|nr:hypothetical protein [Actinomycetota bacterium]